MKTIKILTALVALVFSSFAFASPVNVNTATATEIANALNGIGIKRAEAIVAYRNSNGEFTSPDQLTLVRGIGDVILDKNKVDILIK